MASGIRNLQSFEKAIGRAKARLEGNVTSRYRDFVAKVLHDLALNTPQWSGDLAASWQVVVGKGASAEPNTVTALKHTPMLPRQLAKFKGHDNAVNYAMQRNEFALQSIRWNSNVKIVNTNPTADIIESGITRLRPGNYIPGDIMATATVMAKYNIGRINIKKA
jgi:hypothetical protein